jgi:monoterpene epsilon-lactone hydrolase
MASIQSNLAKYFIRQLRQQSLHYINDVKALRIEQDKAFSKIRPPKNVQFKTIKIGQIGAEWVIPSASDHKFPNRVILYLHGGGYAVGSPFGYRGLVGKLVAETGISAINVDYRLAPEHPFPAGLQDAIQVYCWLLEEKGYNPEQVIFMGDSAGGGLTLSTLLKIKDIGLPQPLTAVVMSPWTDMSLSGDSIETHQDKDPLLLVEHARVWAQWYHAEVSPTNPFVSPLFGDYRGVAPIYIQVGTDEILLSDSLRMIEVAKTQNAPITVDIWENMMHVWHFGWPYVPEARQAIQKITKYIHEIVASDKAQNHPMINPLKAATEITAEDQENLTNSWLRFGSDMLKNFWKS